MKIGGKPLRRKHIQTHKDQKLRFFCLGSEPLSLCLNKQNKLIPDSFNFNLIYKHKPFNFSMTPACKLNIKEQSNLDQQNTDSNQWSANIHKSFPH